MKNKMLLLATMLLVNLFVFGQVKLSTDFAVTVGKPYPVIDANSKDYFYDDNGHAILIKTAGEKVTIQRYDISTMKELGRKEYADFPPYNKVQNIIKVGGKLYYIFSSFNKKEKKEDIYVRQINMETGTFETARLLFTSSAEATVSSYMEPASDVSFTGLGAPVRFEAHSSSDNSKILIRYRIKPQEKKDALNYDIIGFYVFNSNFEKQWGGEVKMPYTEKEMNNIAYGVSKDGTAFMLAFINQSKLFELLSIKSDLKIVANKIDIDGNLFFQQIQIQETADGNFNCTGFYASGIDVKVNWTGNAALSVNVSGVLNFKIDPNGKVISKFDIPFPLELINQYETEKTKDKNAKREGEGNAGVNDLKLIDVVNYDDGSTTVIGEQQYIRNEMYITKVQTIYYYTNVIALKFDKNGKILWMKKLPKTQFGLQGKRSMGIRYIVGSNTNYVLYLDNVKNANISLDQVPEKHMEGKGGYLTAYKINDSTGEIEKHSIFDITNIKGTEAFQFRTTRIFNTLDKVFMLEVYVKGKEDAMIKMELKK